MPGFYKQISQEQTNKIHALKTQIAGFSAQITSLTAQVAAQKDQICLLEQDPGRSSGTAYQDCQAVKPENEHGIPAEDPGQPGPLAAALKQEDTNPAVPVRVFVNPAPRAFASSSDVAIPTASGAPFHKKERRGGRSTEGAVRAQSESKVPSESQAEVVMDSASGLTGSRAAITASPVGSRTLEAPPHAVVAARSKDPENLANQQESSDMRSAAKRVRSLPVDAISQSSKRVRQSTPSPEPPSSSDLASTVEMPVAPCFGPHPQLVYGENVAHGSNQEFRSRLDELNEHVAVSREFVQMVFGGTFHGMHLEFHDHDRAMRHHKHKGCLFVDRAHMLEPTRSHYWDSYELLFAGAGQEWPEEDEGPWHLMVSSSVDGPDEKYVYRGDSEYSFRRTYLSRFFEDLEDEEKKWWGGLIATGSQREGLSRHPRAEIWLRKLQRRTVGVTEYVDAASKGFPMTAEEVVKAYEEGLLPLKTWRLIKEGYRVGFQRRLARELSALQDCDSDDDPLC